MTGGTGAVRWEERYGRLDRLFHRIAFAAGPGQRALGELEASLFGETLEEITLEDPVWITALPRAGTTILLNLLHATGRFASHTYRDVPFVLCPMLWARFARRFRAEEAPHERVHGDGLEISADSPEAFEEMVWKRFWPEHYRTDRILPWRAEERRPEFGAFLETHMRKVVALRRDGPSDARRYLSKDNAHVARMATRPGPLRDGRLVVPFREPVQHAASLLRQHRRFTTLHAEEPFLRRYMSATGHHDFGRELKPIDFGGWLEGAPAPDTLAFWVRYWIATYEHVLEHADRGTTLVSYARLTAEPEAALRRLAGAVGLPAGELPALAGRVRPPRTHDVEGEELPEEARAEASALHERLEALAEV